MSSQEIKALDAYLKDNILKSSKEYQLFQYLIKLHPELEGDSVDVGHILKKLFKKANSAENRKELSNLGHVLSKSIKAFLTDAEFQNNELEPEFLLASAYSRLGQKDLLDKLIDKRKKKGLSEGLNSWHSWHLHRLYTLRYFSNFTLKTALEENSLDQSLLHLDQAYLASKVRLKQEKEVLDEIRGLAYLSIESETDLWMRVRSSTSKNNYIELYVLSDQMLNKQDEASFHLLKKKLLQIGTLLDRNEHINLLVSLINFTSFATKRGEIKFYKEAADLLQYGLETKLLFEDDHISPEIFINLINTTCEAKQLILAQQLFEQWQPVLPPNLSQETSIATQARLDFFNKNFKNVPDPFEKNITFVNQLLELNLKTTALQSQYEMQWDDELLLTRCENFESTLRRKRDQFSDLHKNSFGNFVKMVEALIKMRAHPTSKNLAKKLEDYKQIVCKVWLIKKVNELKGAQKKN
jgi:hypothetical protein